MIQIRRALLSGWDKDAIVKLGRALGPRGVELFATRGTADALEKQGLKVTRLEAWLGSPEILGGRVKTLHPRLHAALLAPRSAEGLAELEAVGSVPIDLVAADLYPFEQAVREKPGDRAHGIEHIDIGGVTLLRAGAKNSDHVVVLPDRESLEEFLALIGSGEGVPAAPQENARRWAARAFRMTSAYDAAIAAWMSGDEELPDTIALRGRRALSLRYGENPHQRAAWYRGADEFPFELLHEGREISWNNLLDVDAATALAGQLPAPSAVVVKHTNPCGAAVGSTAEAALAGAWECDSLSAFGGILAVRGIMTEAAAARLANVFVEVVVAEDFETAALELLRKKKGLRILKGPRAGPSGPPVRVRTLLGGIGAQAGDVFAKGDWRVAGKAEPTDVQRRDLELAWLCAAAGQSNTIALVKDGRMIGIGTGQTSRVDAVHVALYKANRCGHDVRGSSLASDGFFPFRDGVDMALEAGIAAVVQPGGSRRDAEVIEAADERLVPMMFTGSRCFRH